MVMESYSSCPGVIPRALSCCLMDSISSSSSLFLDLSSVFS